MRKFWLLALALSLGFLVAESRAQYPGQPNNYGPSSYPVSQSIMQAPPQVPNYRPAPQVNTQVPNYRPAPQVNTPRPPSTPFQLTGAQEQIYGAGQQLVQPLQQAAPAPTQMPAQAPNHAPNQVHPGAVHPGAATHNTPLPTLHAPAANYPAAQGPGCSTCGPTGMQSAPTMMPQTINQGYAPTTTVMQGSVPAASCAPTTYGYTQSYVAAAPSHNFGDRARNMFGSHSTVSKPWFFGGNVLFLNRSDDKSRPLSFFDSSYTGDVLTTGDARLGVATGIEAFGGRYFNCGRNAIQFSYWGAFPDDQDAIRARTTAGDYRSRNPYQYMTMAGTPSAPTTPYAAYDWYDNAFTHQVSRSAEYHNFEVNLLGFAVGSAARNFNRSTAGSFFSGTRRSSGSHCGYCGGAGCGSCDSSCGSCGTACGGSCGGCSTGSCGTPTKYATGPCNLIAPACGSRLNMTWLAGFRYFRFNDGLLYAASLDDSNINRSADDFYYEVNTQNDLAGVQAGGRLDYCFGKRINVYGFTKAGIYNNQSNLQTRMGTDFDHAYLLDTRTPANPNNNVDYVFDETKNDVAFLTELGAGMGYRVTCKWTATFGYRAVIVNGVATSVDNYRESFANYDDVRNFDNYGSLILHGFNAGATYNF